MSQKSFTTRKNPIDFDIDAEMFYLKAGIAAGQMFEVSSLQAKLMDASGNLDTDAGQVLMKELEKIFEPDSFNRFETRFWGKDVNGNLHPNPVDIATFNEVIIWIFGEALGKGNTPQ
jgi:hypothetical protein